MGIKIDGLDFYKGFVIGAGFTACSIFLANAISGQSPFIDYIPKIPEQEVQQGYVSPNKLKIRCEDLDQNGKLETILKIYNKPYLLRKVNGEPMLSAYEIKPSKIQYRTE